MLEPIGFTMQIVSREGERLEKCNVFVRKRFNHEGKVVGGYIYFIRATMNLDKEKRLKHLTHILNLFGYRFLYLILREI